MKATARPILSAVKCRCYASQATVEKASQQLARGEPKLTRMQDGSILAAVENNSPVVRLGFMFNAGSRYETKSQAGITHTLRNATKLSTKTRTAFGVTKHMQQMGSDITAITTREHMVITANCLRDRLYDCLEILTDVARNPAFKTWEVKDLAPTMKLDVAKYHNEPATMLMEALHEVAFRDTLGMSLYIPEHKIGSFNFVDLQEFSKQHQTAANMALVAVGMDPEEFAFQVQHRYGVKDPKPSTVPTKVKATYSGGEKRIDIASQLTHAAVVTEGASLGSKDLIPLAILQRIMGIGPSVKYSEHLATSKINKAVSQVAKGPFSTSAININYSDSGLFGFYVVGQPDEMDGILKAAAATFGNATKEAISEKDLAGAKSNLKAAIHIALENQDNVLMELGSQALLTGEIISPQQICDEIDRTTVADVQNVAKKVINGKPSMVVVGNLAHTPYLDQIV